jgi:hypothetical protein
VYLSTTGKTVIIYIDPSNAPLAGITESMRDRRTAEFVEALSNQGIEIVGGTETAVLLNLRHLATKAGTLARGQATLISALEELRAVRIDVEAGDLAYINGQNVDSHAISRALESGTPAVCRALQSIEYFELFDGIDKARSFIYNDRVDTSDENGRWLNEQLRQGAERDLQAAGLLSGRPDYADFLDAKPEVAPPDLPAPFRTSDTAWVSPFDVDGGDF